MGGLFSSKAPAPVAIEPPPPKIDSVVVQATSDAERRRQKMNRGRASTMLTGGQGLTTDANTGTKQLMGA
jgi:hypothetical protein